MPENKENKLLFCTLCFASGENGSWNEIVVAVGGDHSHCYNCGAGNYAVELPEWAIDNIRKNGSWVCKRYYPAKEDIEPDNA